MLACFNGGLMTVWFSIVRLVRRQRAGHVRGSKSALCRPKLPKPLEIKIDYLLNALPPRRYDGRSPGGKFGPSQHLGQVRSLSRERKSRFSAKAGVELTR
jgi:hypothetical protein